MKQILTILLICFASLAFSQSDTAIAFTGVIKVDSASQQELYSRARNWFNTSFKSYKSVIEVDDKQTGELSGNGSIKYDYNSFMGPDQTVAGWIHFKISIWVKDGRYKYMISDFEHEGSISFNARMNSGPWNFGTIKNTYRCPSKGNWQTDKFWDARWNEVRSLSIDKAEIMIASLSERMHKPSEQKGDW